MREEKGVVIIAYKMKNAPRYIVLKRKKNWEGWETPKGHLENNDYRETVIQELSEEAGIEDGSIENVEDMEKTVEWTFEKEGEEINRIYKGFLVKVSEDAHVDVSENPHEEHEHGFFFAFRDAKEMITHDNNRDLLEKAHLQITGK